MNPGRRKMFVAGGAMAISTVVAQVAVPRRKFSDSLPKFSLETAIPKRFGEWVVDDSIVPILPSPDVSEALNKIYDQTLNRTYINRSGLRVMLSIAYGSAQTRQLRAHRQEVCYSAQGFQISDLRRATLLVRGAPIPGTLMVARQGSRVEPVTYWFTMGSHAVMSLWDRQRVQFAYSLDGLIPDGFLFRLSSIDPNQEHAVQQHLAFADALLGAVDAQLASRLMGRIA